jgi:phosphatidylserine decarboxylase
MPEQRSPFEGVLPPIHPEGWKFIAAFAVGTLVLFAISSVLGWIGVLLTVWCVAFFRDPPRVTPTRAGLIVSPADGRVQMIEPAPPPPELDMGNDPRLRISIFMNPFDVHVNRAPADGKVTGVAYRPGAFFNAALDKASEENERQAIRFELTGGKDLAVVQIAGLLARRIVCEVSEGQDMRAGERIGMIRFGSRVDVYLDPDMVPLVIVGQRAVAGETVIADSAADEPARQGEVR